MMKNGCRESHHPKNQIKFPLNIPHDPRRKCKGCGQGETNNEKITSQERAMKIVVNSLKVADRKMPGKQKTTGKIEESHRVSSSESGMSYLQGDNNDKMINRQVGYQEPGGTSFGAHLLRKSKPLLAEALDEKLKFKRDTDAGQLVFQKQRKLTQPFFMNEVDSESMFQFRKHYFDVEGSSECPPPPPPHLTKRNMYHNQFLTTNNRAYEGLKYVVNNYPHLPPDSPTGTSRIVRVVQDECGRKTHHPKLRARDLGKRLCEAPSMTQELDNLYEEYIQRCPEGNEQSEACRFLRHAPSPHHREVRRSILKDQHASMTDFDHSHMRKSSVKGHLVRFDKDVDLIGTAITKLNGIDASLLETDGRHKLLRQQGGWISTTNTNRGQLNREARPEMYPLHVKNLVRGAPTPETDPPLDWLNVNEMEDVEEKTAKQDLARIYFTTEATRVMACSNLPALDRKMNVFTTLESARRPPFPHFFMDRLENDKEMEKTRKQQDRLTSINKEMDAFDENVKTQSTASTFPAFSTVLSSFDPLEAPSEKSLNDLKRRMQMMKQQREQDVKAAATRRRTRKSYFHKMLPCFGDVISGDLMEHSIKRACKLSGEEMLLARDLLSVVNQREVWQEHKRKYDEEEMDEEEGDDLPKESKKIVRDILDICIDVVIKISNFTEVTGKEPPESLRREWRDAGFVLLSQQDDNDSRTEQDEEIRCSREGTPEDNSDSSSQYRRSSGNSYATTDDMKDASVSRKEDDEDRMRCLVALKTIHQTKSDDVSLVEEKPLTTVKVQVTDCLHEDIESALTYDGVFLPLSDSNLSQSSSKTLTESSATPSGSPTESPLESFVNCNQHAKKSYAKGLDYEEYEGENGEYFDPDRQMLLPVGIPNGTRASNAEAVELTEETMETTAEGEAIRVGEVEVQAIDYSEGDSPDGVKHAGRHLQFDDVADKHATMDEAKGARKSRARGESNSSPKFNLPRNFESKRNPIRRKKTAYVSSDALNADDDDDDDIDKRNDESAKLLLFAGQNNEFQNEEDGQNGDISVIETEEEYETNEAEDASLELNFERETACTGPKKRKTLVYEELGNISYGMNSVTHERRFVEHRIQQLKQFSETWRKGLFKPAGVLTAQEKNFIPFSMSLSTRKIPPFNILDTSMPRPKFNLRMKKLIGMAEQAQLEKHKCKQGIVQGNAQDDADRLKSARPVEHVISEKSKCKSNKKVPSWHKEIVEYECRRKEREKLMEETRADDDYAKRLGFEAFYMEPVRRTFVRGGPHVHIADGELTENEEDQDQHRGKQSSLERNTAHTCIPDADGVISDNCTVDEYNEAGNVDHDEFYKNYQDAQLLDTHWEIPGEDHYEFFEFPADDFHFDETEDHFSVQEGYNE